MKDVIVRRQRKYEAEQAVADLEARGFELVYGIAEIETDGKLFKMDSYGRKIFIENTHSSCYIAKLRMVNDEFGNS